MPKKHGWKKIAGHGTNGPRIYSGIQIEKRKKKERKKEKRKKERKKLKERRSGKFMIKYDSKTYIFSLHFKTKSLEKVMDVVSSIWLFLDKGIFETLFLIWEASNQKNNNIFQI